MNLFLLVIFWCVVFTAYGRLSGKFSDTADIDEISTEDELEKRVTLWECYDDVYYENTCQCENDDDYYNQDDIKYFDCCADYDGFDFDDDDDECYSWNIYAYTKKDVPFSRKWMIYDVEDGTAIAYGLRLVDYTCSFDFDIGSRYGGTISSIDHSYEYVPIGIGKSTTQYKRGVSGWDFSFKTSDTVLYLGETAYGSEISYHQQAKIYNIYAHNKNSALVQECDYDSSTQSCSEVIQCDYRVVKSKPDPSTFARYGIALKNETTVAANTAADA